MDIAFFVTQFPRISETFIVNQITELQKNGHRVHIFSQHRPVLQKVHQNIEDFGLPEFTFYIDDIPSTRTSKILCLIKKSVRYFFGKNNRVLFKALINNRTSLSIYQFIAFIDKPNYDVLHAHFGMNGVYVNELRKLGLFKDAKFITTFHGYDMDPVFAKSNYYHNLFASCHFFTVNSLYSKRQLKQLGCDENKIHVIPAGIIPGRYATKGSLRNLDNPIGLIFVGRLIMLKGPQLFVQICDLLKKQISLDFKAVIIGDGELYNDINQSIIKYHLESIVELVGSKTQEEVLQYLKRADIFILPGIVVNGLAETQGLVIQEAQAFELPVLISDAGGMKEGMIDGKTGFVLPQNDVQAFADKIKLLAKDKVLRQSIGEEGRKFVEKYYNNEKLTKEVLKLYRQGNLSKN